MKQIYRTYTDTEVACLSVEVACPYCGHEQSEMDKTECGKTYTIECDECGKEYEMYFDAS